MPTQLRAYFHDRDTVFQAVDQLIEHEIPQDQIRVTVEGPDGSELRSIPVKEGSGVLRGALIGAVAGSALAALAVLVFGIGVAPGGAPSVLFTGILSAGAAGATAGIVIGGVLQLGRWRGAQSLTRRELEEGVVVVAVRGEALQARARETLVAVGPDRIEP